MVILERYSPTVLRVEGHCEYMAHAIHHIDRGIFISNHIDTQSGDRNRYVTLEGFISEQEGGLV